MNGYGNYQVFDTTIWLINVAILAGVFIVWLAEYILQGMGLYKLAQAQGIDSPWMAFVPWLRTYLHGKIAGEIPFGKKRMKNAGIWMVIVPIIFGAVIAVSYFAMLVFFFVGSLGSMGMSGGEMHVGGGIFAVIIFLMVFVLIMLAVLVYTAVMGILRGMVNYQIYKRFHSSSKAVLHMLLSAFVPMYQAIYFFMLRKRVHVEPKQREVYQEAQAPQQEAQAPYQEIQSSCQEPVNPSVDEEKSEE